jgi:hypothetical protein
MVWISFVVYLAFLVNLAVVEDLGKTTFIKAFVWFLNPDLPHRLILVAVELIIIIRISACFPTEIEKPHMDTRTASRKISRSIGASSGPCISSLAIYIMGIPVQPPSACPRSTGKREQRYPFCENLAVESRKVVPIHFPKVSQSRAGQVVSILQLPPCLQ